MVISDARVLLVRRASEPLKGEWSIPGGLLELGESLEEGVVREVREETGLEVKVVQLIEVFERIFVEESAADPTGRAASGQSGRATRPRYHFVILDYLCETVKGDPRPGGDVTEVVFASEEELGCYHLTAAATRVVQKAFALAREKAARLS